MTKQHTTNVHVSTTLLKKMGFTNDMMGIDEEKTMVPCEVQERIDDATYIVTVPGDEESNFFKVSNCYVGAKSGNVLCSPKQNGSMVVWDDEDDDKPATSSSSKKPTAPADEEPAAAAEDFLADDDDQHEDTERYVGRKIEIPIPKSDKVWYATIVSPPVFEEHEGADTIMLRVQHRSWDEGGAKVTRRYRRTMADFNALYEYNVEKARWEIVKATPADPEMVGTLIILQGANDTFALAKITEAKGFNYTLAAQPSGATRVIPAKNLKTRKVPKVALVVLNEALTTNVPEQREDDEKEIDF